jgi:glycosyltransferase involved in cell wall biosynthesis
LLSALDEERPDMLYAFLPGPNLMACLAMRRVEGLKVVWGVRASDMDLGRYAWLTRVSYLLERRLSRWPHLIISNSTAGRRHAVAHGFPDDEHFIVIPNGIDVERFRPDAELGQAVREEWGVLPGQTLIGIVARLDPMKDYPTFLHAAAKLVRHDPTIRFVGVGKGPDDYRDLLEEKSRNLGLEGRMIWAGARGDLPAIYNAIDLLVSSSVSEGFSNVLGEAMACGVPCVATDVGDAREILGDIGAIISRGDPDALAEGVLCMLERRCGEGTRFSAELRQRVIEKFSVDMLVKRTSEALNAVC